MSLQPVDQVLKGLRQTQWQQQRQFNQLVQTWSQIVGPAVAAQTQPIQISAQRVLVVATASAVWANNLAFERQRLLHKLNDVLETPLTDIRFSTRQWRLQAVRPEADNRWTPQNLVSPRSHPPTVMARRPPQDYQQAFDRWSTQVRSQNQQQPRCPQCQCSTPMAELLRWSVCSLCWARLPVQAQTVPGVNPPPSVDVPLNVSRS